MTHVITHEALQRLLDMDQEQLEAEAWHLDREARLSYERLKKYPKDDLTIGQTRGRDAEIQCLGALTAQSITADMLLLKRFGVDTGRPIHATE